MTATPFVLPVETGIHGGVTVRRVRANVERVCSRRGPHPGPTMGTASGCGTTVWRSVRVSRFAQLLLPHHGYRIGVRYDGWGVTAGGCRSGCGPGRSNGMTFSSANSEKIPCVYMLTNRRNGALYVGVTSNIARRVWQHKNRLVGGFTKKYGVHRLVWYEAHPTMEGAITREKQMKEWNRDWKVQLIEEVNRAWRDLYREVL